MPQLNIYLPDKVYDDLREQAKNENKTVSQVIQEALTKERGEN